ncbi:GNAT family N-acetyltransferase [Flavobacterium aestuarii]|uniref:GNAT family N-acetyltransferase n=1 Tax=Flavobacterium aestuarii TaxID=3149227 RepID=UPI0032B4229C
MSLKLELLNKLHVKKEFSCGKELLDGYIRTQAKQDYNRDLSVCYVLNEVKTKRVVGYYTLSSNTISRSEFPEDLAEKLPSSYINLPTILLGRLAVDKRDKGNRYGEFLLINALNKAVELSESLGVIAVVVEPIDDEARDFYSAYGFTLIPSNGKMFITIKTIKTSKII